MFRPPGLEGDFVMTAVLFMLVFAVGTLDFSSERAVALWTAVVERAQAALLDHGFGS